MATEKTKVSRVRARYGIGEWYGRLFAAMSPEERMRYAEIASQANVKIPCPWRHANDDEFMCNKKGGVCTIRLYEHDVETNEVRVSPEVGGQLCTTCPNRFYEGGKVFDWIGERIIGHGAPVVLSEIGFLERANMDTGRTRRGKGEVGKIDHVVVHPEANPLEWCALEMQAVYFSGASMSQEFRFLKQNGSSSIPFPQGMRRPDFRSSGPKRLMPQLQIKVPALRRWGKKMAVLVDQAFFSALGRMDDVADISNCDIAWFVIRYDEDGQTACLTPDLVRLTTLERAVEGLTAGKAVSLANFEAQIWEKLGR